MATRTKYERVMKEYERNDEMGIQLMLHIEHLWMVTLEMEGSCIIMHRIGDFP